MILTRTTGSSLASHRIVFGAAWVFFAHKEHSYSKWVGESKSRTQLVVLRLLAVPWVRLYRSNSLLAGGIHERQLSAHDLLWWSGYGLLCWSPAVCISRSLALGCDGSIKWPNIHLVYFFHECRVGAETPRSAQSFLMLLLASFRCTNACQKVVAMLGGIASTFAWGHYVSFY